jgi:hypothetical protein
VNHGHAALGRFYDALWTEAYGSHRQEMGDIDDALRQAGLPSGLAGVGTSTDYDSALRASHHDAVSRIDAEIGTPVLTITTPDGDAPTVFGPVVTALPSATDALRLWQGTLLVAGVPGFREIKA